MKGPITIPMAYDTPSLPSASARPTAQSVTDNRQLDSNYSNIDRHDNEMVARVLIKLWMERSECECWLGSLG